MLKAYKVANYLVYASKGTEAKLLAAPMLRSDAEWREDVAGWVALRAERAPDFDSSVDTSATEPYVISAS